MAVRRLTCALLVFSLAFPCYAYAEEVSYGRQDEQGAVSVSSSEGQGEEGPSVEVGSSGSDPSDSVSSLVQDEGSDSSLVEPISVQPLAAAGNESQLLTTLAYILGYNVKTNTGSFGSDIQVTYGISATGSGILSYINMGNTRLSQISSTLSSISSLLADVNISASSMVSALRNSAGTAIQALQTSAGYLASMNYSAPDGNTYGLGSLLWLVRNSLSADGAIASRLDRLADIQSALGPLSTIVVRLNGDGPIASRLDRLADIQSALAPLSTVVSRLTYSYDGDTYSASSLLFQIMQRLGADSVISNRLSGVIDGIENGSKLIVDAIESMEVPSLDSSSIVSAIDRLIDTVEGLDLSPEISPEVTVNVEDQKEQGLNLLEALLGVLDVAAIASSLSTLSSTLENSFPFGALFMVASALAVLSASPVAPSFSGVVSGVPIDIDLSTFDPLAALCRALLLVLYVIGLYHATRDWVFHSGGGYS